VAAFVAVIGAAAFTVPRPGLIWALERAPAQMTSTQPVPRNPAARPGLMSLPTGR